MAKNNRYYYKVCYKTEKGKYISCRVNNEEFGFGAPQIEYKLNKWVKARREFARKGYHILIFNTLRRAKDFVYMIRSSDDSLVIFRVEYKGIIRMLPPMLSVSQVINRTFSTESDDCWPPGSLMAEQVKLVKKVKL